VRALLVRLSAIGDVIHTLPALAALRGAGWEVDWLSEPASAILLEDNPALRRRIPAPPAKAFRLGPAREALAALRRARYDVALEVQGLWKSAAWARLSGARRVVGWERRFRREPASALLLGETRRVPDAAVHVIDKNLSLLSAVGIEAAGLREFPLPVAPEATARVDEALGSLGPGPFALLIPGGGWQNKLWPAERHGELARSLGRRGLRALVAWGPGERPLAERVAAASGGAAAPCFETTLLELAAVARRAALVVGADTGPLHLACAVSAPVVGLYGPTDPARNGPFAAADEVVRVTPDCAPCHRRSCPVHERVMEGLASEAVLAAVERRLARARERA
jgi:lipopolysaccharide heptosyltransferase I